MLVRSLICVQFINFINLKKGGKSAILVLCQNYQK